MRSWCSICADRPSIDGDEVCALCAHNHNSHAGDGPDPEMTPSKPPKPTGSDPAVIGALAVGCSIGLLVSVAFILGFTLRGCR